MNAYNSQPLTEGPEDAIKFALQTLGPHMDILAALLTEEPRLGGPSKHMLLPGDNQADSTSSSTEKSGYVLLSSGDVVVFLRP